MFKKSFKYYKSRCPPPNFSEVIDFNIITPDKPFANLEFANGEHFCGLIPVSQWKVSSLAGHPGFLHVSNPFTKEGFRYWVCRSLSVYTRRPHCKLNIDALGELADGELWWETCTQDPKRAERLLPKLRWATLGYHHHWDTKEYSEAARDPFPGDLAALCRFVAAALNYPSFEAQAAIANFYHSDSTLAGHTDHSERNPTAPLLSFSFGCSAVFLLGGRTPDTQPSAMFLHSGDIVVMAGDSRLCYHAVPRILPNRPSVINSQHTSTLCSHCAILLDSDHFTKCINDEFWQPFEHYVRTSRINLNVRQVLFSGQSKLDDDCGKSSNAESKNVDVS